MTGSRFEVDFSNLEGSSVAVVDTAAIPRGLWPQLHNIQLSALEMQLLEEGVEGRQRAERILHTSSDGPSEDYVDSRMYPWAYVGEKGWWRDDQDIRNPRMAVLYKGDRLAGAVVVDDNVSGSERARAIKGFIPHKNYLRVREGYIDPELHQVEGSQEGRTVSGLVVAGLYHILLQTNRWRGASAYVVKGNPADAEMEGLTQVSGMHPNPPSGQPQSGLAGYPEGTVVTRVESNVRSMRRSIRELPGASDALGKVVLLDELSAA